jgi:hypothetical protein
MVAVLSPRANIVIATATFTRTQEITPKFIDPLGTFPMRLLDHCNPTKGAPTWVFWLCTQEPIAVPDLLPVGRGVPIPHPDPRPSGTPGQGAAQGPAVGADEYGSKSPEFVTPGIRELGWDYYNEDTHEYERSKVYYDEYGRQIGRTDHTDHGFPGEHTNPQHHGTEYAPGYSFKGHEIGFIPGPYPGGPSGRR